MSIILINCSYAITSGSDPPEIQGDGTLVMQKIMNNLDKASSLEFVGRDILLIKNNDDKVNLIRNFEMKKYPILDVNVFNHENESGLLGVTSTTVNNTHYVFLFYSDFLLGMGKEFTPGKINRVYRYEWNESSLELVNPALILDLPFAPTNTNSGGKIIVGPDYQLYTVIGDPNKVTEQRKDKQDLEGYSLSENKSLNDAILRTTLNGQPNRNNPFHEKGFERYFAYGIRECISMAFDPITGFLWATVKGSSGMPEVNLISSGFDSGGKQSAVTGSGNDEPNFIWKKNSTLTALTFVNSSGLGNKYVNDLLLGDTDGYIYDFKLDNSRENLNIEQNLSKNVFASGLGSISDLKIGTDGALYVLTLTNNSSKETGSLYRISKNTISLPLDVSQVRVDYVVLISISTITISTLLIVWRSKKLRSMEV